ncbi:acyl carrier protein [Actinomadura viridis]|uniref:Act minimal PKS acyl carrier protein n=1 Tax=Actinomadura viridis TaxID=58110 RepID=A0A931DU60_9ACTN|nr:acyl carrier protein [Actinomadura viridis]MBG6093630.1 act minimal PKS acyl carrier protein [Actinomadura viridis]
MTNDGRITLAQLVSVLRECAGEDEGVDLSGDIGDRTFTDLGYDSLALLETSARMAERFRLELDDDVIGELTTPAELLRYLNDAPAKSGEE